MASPARMVVGLLAITTILVLLNLLVLRRTSSAFELSARRRRALALGLAVPLAGTLLLRAVGRWIPVGSGETIAVVVSAVETGVIMTASFLGLGALAVAAARAARRLWRRARPGPAGSTESSEKGESSEMTPASETAPPGLETPLPRPETPLPGPGTPLRGAETPVLPRRVLLEQAAVGSALLVGGGSAGYGAMFGRHDYEMSTVVVPIPGLPRAASGFTIVQLSDIHLGQMVGEPEMRAAEELVRKANGNLLVLTGDLVDHDARYTEQLGRLVRRLAAILPVVTVPGNHDYYTGIDDVLATVRAAGATALVNEAIPILGERDGFALIGLDDPWGRGRAPAEIARSVRAGRAGRGPDLAAALAGVRPDAPRIVLCHNPSVFVETAGQVALQIAGHTHGGQVNLGFRPADYVLWHGYIAGLYTTNGSHLYVNRGFGTAGPAVRVGAPPEVTRLVLVPA